MKINCIVINDPDVLLKYIQNSINQMSEAKLTDIVKGSVEALKIIETGNVNLIIAGIPEKRSFFFADVNGRRRKINYCEIVYVESAGNYVVLIGKTWKVMVYKSMIAMQNVLISGQFIRIHKSFIISVDYIESFKGNKCTLHWDDEKRVVPIGNSFKENFLKALRIPS